jgi:hypothetical protein
MLRLVAMVFLVLSSALFTGSAAAAECELGLDSVALQTRDGQPWSSSKLLLTAVVLSLVACDGTTSGQSTAASAPPRTAP